MLWNRVSFLKILDHRLKVIDQADPFKLVLFLRFRAARPFCKWVCFYESMPKSRSWLRSRHSDASQRMMYCFTLFEVAAGALRLYLAKCGLFRQQLGLRSCRLSQTLWQLGPSNREMGSFPRDRRSPSVVHGSFPHRTCWMLDEFLPATRASLTGLDAPQAPRNGLGFVLRFRQGRKLASLHAR